MEIPVCFHVSTGLLSTPLTWDTGWPKIILMTLFGSRWLAVALIGLNLLVLMLMQQGNTDLIDGDFKMFWSGAIAVRSGHSADLYDWNFHASVQKAEIPSLKEENVKVYTHPPYELLLFLPLSYTHYKTACYLWWGLTLVLAVLCGRTLGSYAAVRWTPRLRQPVNPLFAVR